MKKKIAVLYGGNSSEAEISIKSGKQVVSWIDKERYEVYPIIVNNNEWMLDNAVPVDKTDFSAMRGREKIKFDFAYIMIHGTPGENGLMPGYFEMLGIPHSTCSSLISSLTFNKYLCKLVLKELNLNMARSLLLRRDKRVSAETVLSALGLPCFVKPNNGGSSCGVSKVNKPEELDNALKTAFREDNEVIVEEYVKGIEVSNGILKTKNRTIVMPLTQIISKKEFFDYEAKYTEGMSEEITPAKLPEDIVKECQRCSGLIYDFLGCKGIVRVDYIIKDNKPYFLEINTVPGMSGASIIPKQAEVYGISVPELLTCVIEDM